jgi:hypothetical protein
MKLNLAKRSIALVMKLRRLSQKRLMKLGFATSLAIGTVVLYSCVERFVLPGIGWSDTGISSDQSEPKEYIGSWVRYQQAHFTEFKKFASKPDLGAQLPIETNNSMHLLPTQGAIFQAAAKKKGIKSYTGAVFPVNAQETGKSTALGVICESKEKSKIAPDIQVTADIMPPPQCMEL